MKARVIVTAVILLPLLLATRAFAEAWPRGEGRAYLYLGGATSESDTYRTQDGDRVPFPGRDNRETRLSLYGEAGITDSLTLVFNVPYKAVRTRGLVSAFETSGLADADLRLRWSTQRRGTWFGLEGGVIVPLGYDAEDFPPLGSGETDGIVNFAVGTSVGWLPEGFASVDVGWRFRGGELDDEIPYAAKLGAFPVSRIGLFAFVRGYSSRAEFSEVDPNFGLSIADSEKTAGGLELYLRLTNRVDANLIWTTTLRGRNINDGDELGLGLAVHLD